MAFYQFTEKQFIPADIDKVWDFISSPKNLKKITPDYMGFDITSLELPEKMYSGMIISYKVKPFLGITMTWVTEITHVEEKRYFVDEQRSGPYAFWHHQHIIKPLDSGVEMTDIISYKPPLGFIGKIANKIFIRKQLRSIFQYRERALRKMFGEP